MVPFYSIVIVTLVSMVYISCIMFHDNNMYNRKRKEYLIYIQMLKEDNEEVVSKYETLKMERDEQDDYIEQLESEISKLEARNNKLESELEFTYDYVEQLRKYEIVPIQASRLEIERDMQYTDKELNKMVFHYAAEQILNMAEYHTEPEGADCRMRYCQLYVLKRRE